MAFSTLDIVVIAAYLIGVALFGVLLGGRQKSAKDYFLSESSVPWWAVCLAIVATETSAITFISVPGLAYAGSFHFLQLAFGYLLGRIAVAVFFIPRYFEGELTTAYAFLERRFSPTVRKTASITFMATRLLADGVRLYTTAIPLALLLQSTNVLQGVPEQWVYVIAIAVMSALTLVYVIIGGVRAVIWTDVVQLVLYIGGAIAAVIVLSNALPEPLGTILSRATSEGKLTVFNFGFADGFKGFFSQPLTLIAGLVGGFFLSMASHGSDQIIVQRLMATNNVGKARKAIVWSGVLVIIQFAIFLFVGMLLYYFYGPNAYTNNEVFPRFIIDHVPTGLSGLIIAAILAAAMSTLSGSVSALASSTMMDILIPLSKKTWSEARKLALARRLSIGWGVVLILIAMTFIQTPHTVIELALGIASYTYGGLLGLFLTGMLAKRISAQAALTGFFCGVAGMTAVILFTDVAWTWYTLIGTGLTFLAASLSQTFFVRARSAVKPL